MGDAMDNPFELEEPPAFPPLFEGREVAPGTDPFAKAQALAVLGCDAGTLVHAIDADRLRAALVLVPEMPLEPAMAALVACAVGFQNALGALAPPEVAVHLTWDGTIRVNGATCGGLHAAAADRDPGAVPAWLVVGLNLRLRPDGGIEEGLTPDRTSLAQEGCGAVSPVRLLEAWARHSLVWLNHVDSGDTRPLHREWRGLVEEIGQQITLPLGAQTLSGTFVGVDENFGLLLRDGDDSRVVPLSSQLQGDTP